MSKNKNSTLWVSQNFLTSSSVINRIINISSINNQDHVIEIGPGKGHITRELAKKCKKVTAVEYDKNLYEKTKIKLSGMKNIQLINNDFLRYNLPYTPYKVFANIPFNRTTSIIKKLTENKNPPEEAWLVMEKGAAKRFMGKPHENVLSLILKPFYDLKIVYYFRKEDFHPCPSVDIVLLHIKKKTNPDILQNQISKYTKFINNCLANRNYIYRYLSKKQISKALSNSKLSHDITSKDMLYIQWLCLFRCYLQFVSK